MLIHSTPEKIFEAITTEVGYIIKLCYNERKISFRMRIEALDPARQVTWRCMGDVDEWENTTIIFKLKPAPNNSTILHFEHLAWRRTDGIFGQSNYGWGFHLRNLKWFLETGSGWQNEA